MSFVLGVLTFLLVLICMFLILLVLVQLPKKDAGAGMAFGAGTADALFGAGSGNALTKITKYTAIGFLALSLVLGWMQSRLSGNTGSTDFTKMVEQKQQQAPMVPPPQSGKQQTAPAAPANNGLLSIPMPATNAPAPTAAKTNSAK